MGTTTTMQLTASREAEKLCSKGREGNECGEKLKSASGLCRFARGGEETERSGEG